MFNLRQNNVITGGHCVWQYGYDADWLYLSAWGEQKRMSWGFLRQFRDEAYGLV
ncbi:hypothetical protein AA23498_2524 [Acetobacter nitrogenifigens DSM 23921 = NBRC 105050]|uniref:Uncharacterized protein n=1 Tax=Acetobacter nitrogenifigens DSM 23921 = NBRC 105050 TaxID=1120919 RepID=A0A511X693_9PROT|nr:hypothetical protein [Acetobacter nitrogenifigens]GBQ96054.1 hypothetical protein AA23498_2524 [Acetobacter nitrogenifigens DSM 23921 = NBRC 105050]GEN58460.1 hypothetical protein ANI02nite_03440 [Acetobacter nitrogenifigens DSM 23921 = NBRC 105050]